PEAERSYAAAVGVLRRAAALDPSPDGRTQLAASLADWAGYLGKDAGRRAQAEKAYREALGLLEKLCAEYPDTAYRLLQARALTELGVLLQATDPRRAEKDLTDALKLCEKLPAADPDVRDYRFQRASTLLNLGVVWELSGQP